MLLLPLQHKQSGSYFSLLLLANKTKLTLTFHSVPSQEALAFSGHRSFLRGGKALHRGGDGGGGGGGSSSFEEPRSGEKMAGRREAGGW